MNLKEKIYDVLEQFVGEHYGESADDACYDLNLMAKLISVALEKDVISYEKKISPGSRVRCISMNDGPCEGYSVKPFTIPSGSLGTVAMTDDAGQIHVNWDCGSTLALIPGVDEFEIISSENSSGCSIKRDILGQEYEIELTIQELEKAYRKAAYNYRLEDIKAKIAEMICKEEGLGEIGMGEEIPNPTGYTSHYSKALRELYKSPETFADEIEKTLENHDSYQEAFKLSIEYVIENEARELAKTLTK